jgi:hypothetical protein
MSKVIDSKIYDYIIIGCGIGGISYAYKNPITNFLILEKNNYIGGRIKNINWHNTWISLGAGIGLLPTNNYTIELCKIFNLEFGNFTQSYHLTDLQGRCPNNILYYKDNDDIFKVIKKYYLKNKEEIIRLKLTFKDFLHYYFENIVVKTIRDNALYSSPFNADVKYVIDNEFTMDILRNKDEKILFINNNNQNKKLGTGYDFLIENLLTNINISNIKLNSNVKKINYINNLYEIIYNTGTNSQSMQIFAKKIVLATDIKSNIEFNIKPHALNLLNHIYNSIGFEPFIKIHSWHKTKHNLNHSCKSKGLLGKSIIIDEYVLIICYNEGKKAVKLNNFLNTLEKNNQIDFIYKLCKKYNINITRPDDIFIQFWNCGMHYPKPNCNIERELYELKLTHNIEIIGEIVSKIHGWVDSALSTVY